MRDRLRQPSESRQEEAVVALVAVTALVGTLGGLGWAVVGVLDLSELTENIFRNVAAVGLIAVIGEALALLGVLGVRNRHLVYAVWLGIAAWAFYRLSRIRRPAYARRRRLDSSPLPRDSRAPWLERATPKSRPKLDLLEHFDTRTTGTFEDPAARALLWASALEATVRESSALEHIRGVREVTYGFVDAKPEPTLAVIAYVHSARMLQRQAKEPVKVGDHEFPIVIRPYLFRATSNRRSPVFSMRTCGVENSAGKRGFLTVEHTMRGSRDKKRSVHAGEPVSVTDQHGITHGGPVLDVSSQLDAVAIACQRGPRHGSWDPPIRVSRTMGYKEVDILAWSGPVRARVVEIRSPEGVISSDPSEPARLYTNPPLSEGDSGALVLDLEHGEPGEPYAMYLGVIELHTGERGRILMLAQIGDVLGLTFHWS